MDPKLIALEIFKTLAAQQLATGHDLRMEKQVKLLRLRAKDSVALGKIFSEVYEEETKPAPKSTIPAAPAAAPAK